MDAEIERLMAERDALLRLLVRPFRGRWEAFPGDRHMDRSMEVALYKTRDEAVAATFQAAARVMEDDRRWASGWSQGKDC